MSLSTTLGGVTYRFGSLREVMAKATPLRSGDCLAGLAATSEQERVAARWVLAVLHRPIRTATPFFSTISAWPPAPRSTASSPTIR